MPQSLSSYAFCGAIALGAILLAGCAGSAHTMAPQQTTTSLALAQASRPSLIVTPTPWPTPTPTAISTPSATPLPTASPAEALALLQMANSHGPELRSARGSLDYSLSSQLLGAAQTISMTGELEFNNPDFRWQLHTKGLPQAIDLELIIKGDTMYVRIGNKWNSYPAGNTTALGGSPPAVDVDMMRSYLGDALDAKMEGQRTVGGVFCDVVSFRVAPERVGALADAVGDMGQIARFEGEVAIARTDKLPRQMTLSLAGGNASGSRSTFSMHIDLTLWDVNTPGIVIDVPESATPPGILPRILPRGTAWPSR